MAATAHLRDESPRPLPQDPDFVLAQVVGVEVEYRLAGEPHAAPASPPSQTSQPAPQQLTEFILAQTVGDEVEYSLAPVEGRSAEEISRSLSPPLPLQSALAVQRAAMDEASPWERLRRTWREKARFTMFESLAAMTLLAVGLAAATWLPLNVFAGALGVLTLLFLLTSAWRSLEHRLLVLAWGVIGLLYVGASVAAIVSGWK